MKTVFLLLVAALALCGCSKSESDQVQALEKRIAELERRADVQKGQIKDLANIVLEGGSNMVQLVNELKPSLLAEIKDIQSDLVREVRAASRDEIRAEIRTEVNQILEERAAAFKAGARPATAPQPSRSQPAATKHVDGVPAEVYARIAARAAQLFPDDFSTQKYAIDQELKAWRALNP